MLTQQLVKGWSVTRLLFTLSGSYIIASAMMNSNRLALLPGIYFLAMGLFGFGCAGGSCTVRTQNKKT